MASVTNDGTPFVEPQDPIASYPAVSQELAAVIDSLRTMIPVGAIFPYAGKSAPEGYLMCDGKAYTRTDFYDLFMIMAEWVGEWGGWPGGNTSQFYVPDLRGRSPIGVTSLDDNIVFPITLGRRTGDRRPPYHRHHGPGEVLMTTYTSGGSKLAGWNSPGIGLTDNLGGQPTDSAGNDNTGHELPPVAGVNFIVWTGTTTTGKNPVPGVELAPVTTRQMIEARLEEKGIGEEEIEMLREQLKKLETADA